MLDEEFKYYLDNQKQLLKKYNNRFIVIVDGKVVGDYGSMEEAYSTSGKKYQLGKFLIQKCSPGDKDYTVTYHSRARFA